jgi:hypothetical protein
VHQEVVAIALEIVANEFEVVAVGDVADALGEERIVRPRPFPGRPAPACGRSRRARQFIDKVARRQAAHRKGELCAERHAVEHRRQGKADQRGGERAAENDDDGVDVVEHPEIAAHQDKRTKNDDAREQSRLRWRYP